MKQLATVAVAVAVSVGAFAASTNARAQSVLGAPLFAVLNGGNECNAAAPPQCRLGDLDAIGSATISFAPRDAATHWVCWGITADNLAAPTAAHIHSNVSGLNGAIVVPLTPPVAPLGGNPGASSGCVPATIAIVNAIRLDPTRFYVNVHSVAFPNGAIRGQLH